MEIDRPEVKTEVEAAFARYETALTSNDVATLDELFHADARTIRYGIAENLYGHVEIAAFRSARPAHSLMRRLERTVISTYGDAFATAMTLFHREPGKIGRQSQTWVKFPEGWRIVAAHVSVIAKPAGQ